MVLLHYPFDMSNIQWDAWSAIGTLLAAFLTLWIIWLTRKTVNEMKTQREKSYQPDLVLEKELDFRVYQPLHHYEYCMWDAGNENKSNDYVGSLSRYIINLNVFNIGIGTAKNIRFKYKIPNEKILEEFTKNKVEDLTLKLEDHSIAFHSHFNGKPIGINVSKYDLKTKKVFAFNSNESFKILFPKLYLNMFSMHILSGNEIHDPIDRIMHENNFPALKLNVKYDDLGMKPYEKNFKIKISVHSSMNWKFPYKFCKIKCNEILQS